MAVGRRELMLGTLGMGLALAAGFRPVRAQGIIAQPFSTYGVVPRTGDQTAALQDAADQAAGSGTPFFLPPGNYMSGKLELKSGTEIQGVPGKSVLCYTGGGALSRLSGTRGQIVRIKGISNNALGIRYVTAKSEKVAL
jgi:Pectate lyase superfamily protein